MTTGKALNGKPYAGNPHVRFDEGEVASAAMPRRGSLLYKQKVMQGTALPYKRERACVFIIAFSVVAFSLYAGEIRWTGGGQTASMSDGDNWGGTVPGASDTAVVYGNTAATPAIAPGGNATYTGLWVSNYGDGFVLQTNGTLTVTGSDALRIGRCPGNTGHYTITNGTLKATTGSLFVGINGATGSLKISGRGIVEAPKLTEPSFDKDGRLY